MWGERSHMEGRGANVISKIKLGPINLFKCMKGMLIGNSHNRENSYKR